MKQGQARSGGRVLRFASCAICANCGVRRRPSDAASTTSGARSAEAVTLKSAGHTPGYGGQVWLVLRGSEVERVDDVF